MVLSVWGCGSEKVQKLLILHNRVYFNGLITECAVTLQAKMHELYIAEIYRRGLSFCR